MKRTGVPEESHDAASALPGASLEADHARRPADPPAVPVKFWKGVAFGLFLTFAIVYGAYRLL
jgi:hypothetical protein